MKDEELSRSVDKTNTKNYSTEGYKGAGVGDLQDKGVSALARAEGIKDARLVEAVERADAGLVDADLGGGVIKQRVAREGQGKSGGYRTILLFRQGERAIFAYGFAKNDRDNIDRHKLAAFRKAAALFLGFDEAALAKMIESGAWSRVETDKDET